MNNIYLDNIIFKIISLITYNNNFFKSFYLLEKDFIIKISKLKILELKDLNFNDNIIEIYNKIYQDYELIQNYNTLILNYNKQINIMNKIHNDIIFINLENINDMYLELLEYFSKKKLNLKFKIYNN